MNINGDIVSFLILLFPTIFVFSKQLLQIKQIKTQQVLVGLHTASFTTLILSELFLLMDKIHFSLFLNIAKISIAFNFAIYLTLVGLVCIQEAGKKKIRTLLRIPVIGLLTGAYFDFKYVVYICMGQILLLFVIPLSRRLHFRYLIVKLLPFLLCLVFAFFLMQSNLIVINLFVLTTVIVSSGLVTLSIVNSLLNDQGHDYENN